MNYRIDALQYANWSEEIFQQMRDGGAIVPELVHVPLLIRGRGEGSRTLRGERGRRRRKKYLT